MRLLNVNSFEVEQFFDGKIRKYAILSHTWESEEPNHAEMVARRAQDMRGYGKIKLAAAEAKRNGLNYLWVDTICIDKTNSAELSEAINSMYKWYEASQICYVYLADVHSSDDLIALQDSRWFTRGWTLQELLAPLTVEFFTSSWASMGKRSDPALEHPILAGCNIKSSRRDVLTGFKRKAWSVAERMSWASRRETTRGEDMAYCLLGIFDVHMPLLYGEGERAFIRLQEEIMRVSDDRSIFAWADPEIVPGTLSGLLARNPAAFAIASTWRHKDRWSSETDQYAFRGDPHRMTSEGIYLQMPLYQSTDFWRYGEYHGMLGGDRTTPGPAIVLERLANNDYARLNADRFATTSSSRKQEPYLHDNQQDQDGVNNIPHSDWLGASIYGAYAYPQRIIVKQRPPILRKGLATELAVFLLPESRASRDTDFGLELISVDPLGCWQRDQNTVDFTDKNQVIRVNFEARHQYHDAVRFSVELSNDGTSHICKPNKISAFIDSPSMFERNGDLPEMKIL
ncbi:hypothetical protein E8E13_003046 [Curvularia kusanoi]|uniref:Heterokaryon incompatibility domain-containing protein n=1 Tax=Curvularia kusanoi TaxID=90978 RepID=A0A9P4W835_CURKU|nr:hypothetical protein E8E13_003046 [Curvularia kusanoi]